MTETLDNILSGRGEAVSEHAATEHETRPFEGEGQGQSDSLHQSFETESDEPATTDVNGQKMVPHAALHASKEKLRRTAEQIAGFERTLNERDAAWERRLSAILEAVKPQQEQPPAPDFHDNPADATRHVVAPQFDQINQTLMANAQLIAGVKYGDDKVTEAEQAFITALRSQKVDPVDYHTVVGSPNRYAAAVHWHQRQLAQAEIGDDPAAFRAKVEAELRARYGLTDRDAPAHRPGQPSVMPTNLATARNVGARNGPAWSGPTPLGDILAQPSIFKR